MKHLFVSMLVILIFTNVLHADTLTSLSDTKELSNRAASLLAKDKTKEAVSLFKPYWPLPPTEIDMLILKIQNQTSMISSRFGKVVGFEFLKQQQVGKCFVRYIYILKYENHAMRWLFTFYKPQNKWLVNSVYFDDKLSELFE